MRLWAFLALMIVPVSALASAGRGSDVSEAVDCVVLLHGLARSDSSMSVMEKELEAAGYRVINQPYPSRRQPVEALAGAAISDALTQCVSRSDRGRVHFVTHSMGGILVRYYLATHHIEHLGRVVMLSPPNQGSEVVDKLGSMPGFGWLNGPAGQQLGTHTTSMPNQLGAAGFELGIITGNRSVNLILSMLIPGPDDGKVAVERARLEGMSDFLVVPHSHPFIMKKPEVIRQTLYFLQQGKFDRSAK